MEIMEIKFAGFTPKGCYVPATFAAISRIPGEKHIRMKLISCDGEQDYHCAANDEKEIWDLALKLQKHLDGHAGTNSMIHDYYRQLQSLAD